MKRTYIENLKAGTTVNVRGFVDKIRDTKYVVFIMLRDITGKLQITVVKDQQPKLAEQLAGLTPESVISVTGKYVANPGVKAGGYEILPDKIEIQSIAKPSPIDAETGPDMAMDYRWLDLRLPHKNAIFKLQTHIVAAIRKWFVESSYIEIMTPKITAQATEGGAEVFEVKYFDQKAYLTQSSQFYKQMSIAADFEKTFEIGPAYRAEKSHTNRHATEFFCLDVEIGHIDSSDDVMDAQESMITSVFKELSKEIDIEIPTAKFPRIKLSDALDLLEKEKGYKISRDKGDLDPEGERLLCEIAKEKWDSEFIFITNFPSTARSFYIMRDDNDPKLTFGYDLLYRGVEITSGGQREHRPEKLRENIKKKGMNPADLEYYIQFFEYGCPLHGGYCIGLARLITKMLNLSNVKESTFLFRGPDRLSP